MRKTTVVVIFLISLGSLRGMGWAEEAPEPDYFPLQLGNRWVYGYFHDDKEWGTKELTVADTVTIGDIEEPTLFRSLPTFSEGYVYYKLCGAMVEVFFLFSEADTVVARKDASGDLLVRGLHYIEESWIIEQEDRLWIPFADLNRLFRGELPIEEAERLARWEIPMGTSLSHSTRVDVWAYEFGIGLEPLSVPAGSFDNAFSLRRFTAHPGTSHTMAPIWFAPEVGVVRVGLSSGMLEIRNPHLALKEAIVAGIHYPGETTSVEAATWGQVKAHPRNR